MTKEPRLTLLDPQQTAVVLLAPPANLNKTGRDLWQSVMSEYDIRDSGGQQMLQQICEAADRVHEFRAIISRDGPVVRTKAGPKDHPLIKHDLAARPFIVRFLRLGLDVEPVRAVGRGVEQDDTPENSGDPWDQSILKAIALQKRLLEIAGWPDCRAEYDNKLHKAEEHVIYCRERVMFPPAGEFGTGARPAERQEALEEALQEVEYRQELLAGLEAMQTKWEPVTTRST